MSASFTACSAADEQQTLTVTSASQQSYDSTSITIPPTAMPLDGDEDVQLLQPAVTKTKTTRRRCGLCLFLTLAALVITLPIVWKSVILPTPVFQPGTKFLLLDSIVKGTVNLTTADQCSTVVPSLLVDDYPRPGPRVADTPYLVIYPGEQYRNRRLAVLGFPGGAYETLFGATTTISNLLFWDSDTHIEMLAQDLNASVFALQYVTGPQAYPNQPSDAAMAALQVIETCWVYLGHNATAKPAIGLSGLSAGGHLAATISAYNVTDSVLFTMLNFPVISMDRSITNMPTRETLIGEHPAEELVNHFSLERHPERFPPIVFAWCSITDWVASPQNTIRMHEALVQYRNATIPEQTGRSVNATVDNVGYHVFPSGGHGTWNGAEVHLPSILYPWLNPRVTDLLDRHTPVS